MSEPLHPNLARVASEYDTIMSIFSRGEITPQQARNLILSLVARDDNGVIWSLDPDTGTWFYRNKDNKKVTANPPTIGVKSYTPKDLGSVGGRNIDNKITHIEIDKDFLHSPLRYSGTTYRSINTSLLKSKKILIFFTTSIFAAIFFVSYILFL